MMDHAEYFWTHPPRCIAGFKAQPVELPGVEFDGHPSMSDFAGSPYADRISAPENLDIIFLLYCTCGSDRHYILGHYWRNPDYNNVLVFLSPLALRCAACGKVTELIDTDIHGYDGECGHGVATKRGEGRREEYLCDECGPQPLEGFVRFEYPDDLFTEDFAEFRGREQDLFTWFSVAGKCVGCSRLLHVTEFECA